MNSDVTTVSSLEFTSLNMIFYALCVYNNRNYTLQKCRTTKEAREAPMTDQLFKVQCAISASRGLSIKQILF